MKRQDLVRWQPERGFKLEGHPPGGRCMPTRCYCGKCPWYVPLSLTPAEHYHRSGDKRQAESWANRDEPTWMEKN